MWLTQAEETFEIEVPDRPLLVRFDEGNYLLKELTFAKSVDKLIYQLRSDDVIGRMWAAERLAESPADPRVADALVEVAGNDSFWSVRESAVAVVSRLSAEKHVSFFKEMALDPSSKVRTAALEALGQATGAEAVAFLQARFRHEDSYLAQAEALKSLGEIGDPGAIEFLKEAVELESPRDIVSRAAREALKQLADRE